MQPQITAETIAHESVRTVGSQGTKKSQSDLFSASETDSAGVPERPKGHGLGPCA